MLNSSDKRMLNQMNTTALEAKLGTAVSNLETDVADLKGRFVTHTLVDDDVATGIATVDTGVDFANWYSVMVTAADGTPRAITKIAKGATTNKTKILITATNVAATDIVSVIVK